MDSVIVLPVRVEALESEYAACPSDGEFRIEFAFEPEQQEQSRATVIRWVVEKNQDLEFKHIPLFTNDEEPKLRLGKSVKFKKSERRNLFQHMINALDRKMSFSRLDMFS